MGQERTETWKQVYLLAAGLIIILLAGCAVLQKLQIQATQSEKAQQAREQLIRSRDFLARGDFEAALKESQKVLSLTFSQAPVDEALFTTGLIWAHPDNSKRDLGKAIGFFTKLTKSYPRSKFAEETKILIGVLHEIRKLEQLNSKLEQANEKLTRVIEQSRQVDIEVEGKKRERVK